MNDHFHLERLASAGAHMGRKGQPIALVEHITDWVGVQIRAARNAIAVRGRNVAHWDASLFSIVITVPMRRCDCLFGCITFAALHPREWFARNVWGRSQINMKAQTT